MHRYQPRFHIVYLPPKNGNAPYASADHDHLHTHYRRFIFTETSFTAVTAYQNQRVCSSFHLFLKLCYVGNIFNLALEFVRF